MRRPLGFLLILASTLWAQPGAVLQASSPVNVNGKSISRSYVLFESDTVQTFASSAAITQHGSSVLIGSNSLISYSRGGIRLSSGSALVTTTQRLNAQVGKFGIEPTSANARFSVTQMPSQILIASLQGTVAVHDENRAVTVTAGSSLALPLVAYASQSVETPEDRRRRCKKTKAAGDTSAAKGCEAAFDLPQPTPEAGGAGNGGFIAGGVGTAAVIAAIFSISLNHMSAGGP